MNIVQKIHNELYKMSLDTDRDVLLIAVNILSKDENVNEMITVRYVENEFSIFNDDLSFNSINDSEYTFNDYFESVIENYYDSDYDIVLYNLDYVETLN